MDTCLVSRWRRIKNKKTKKKCKFNYWNPNQSTNWPQKNKNWKLIVNSNLKKGRDQIFQSQRMKKPNWMKNDPKKVTSIHEYKMATNFWMSKVLVGPKYISWVKNIDKTSRRFEILYDTIFWSKVSINGPASEMLIDK